MGGWKLYEDISDNYSEKIDKIIENNELTIEVAMKKMVQIHDQIKFPSRQIFSNIWNNLVNKIWKI